MDESELKERLEKAERLLLLLIDLVENLRNRGLMKPQHGGVPSLLVSAHLNNLDTIYKDFLKNYLTALQARIAIDTKSSANAEYEKAYWTPKAHDG